jgi:hypothetical protein
MTSNTIVLISHIFVNNYGRDAVDRRDAAEMDAVHFCQPRRQPPCRHFELSGGAAMDFGGRER